MSRYRKVDPRIWNDAKFTALGDKAKLAFFMLLTHPSMTALGAMRGSLPGLAAEMHWTPEAFREAFREAFAKGMAEHDERASFIALPNFLKYNPPESPNVVKAWVGALDLLPECELKSRVIARAQAYAEGMTEAFREALPEAFAKAMPYQEQEQEQEQNKKQKQTCSPVGDLFPGVAPQVVADFRAIRTAKKAPVTKTAMDGIAREANKAGLNLQAALAMCCERGWSGFKAEWLLDSTRGGKPAPSGYRAMPGEL